MQKDNKLYLGNNLEVMPKIETDSIDAIVTDPPYGISFMRSNWDVSIPSINIWQECLRVLKPGAFAFVMCIPRQDCLARMICRLEDAGFTIGFSSIYWTYATGFPKAQNLSKAAQKRNVEPHISRKLEGGFSGVQLKPAVEVVIVAMKPIEEKTYLDQAISNNHGATWLNNCRIPFKGKDSLESVTRKPSKLKKNAISYMRQDEPMFGGTGHKKGRFPANVLCEDDVLSDGIERKSGQVLTHHKRQGSSNLGKTFKIRDRTGEYANFGGDSGSFSRYFSLDAWFAERIKELPEEAQKTFPWLIVQKATKTEKNRGLEGTQKKEVERIQQLPDGFISSYGNVRNKPAPQHNFHPTVKPLKLMTWLIILGTQEGEIVLDPFMGSGTTPLAAKMTNRCYKGIELNKEFFDIAVKRVDEVQQNMNSF